MSAAQNPTQGDEIVSEIHIAAPPARVFQALTDPREVVRWWGQKGIYRCREFTTDLRVGGQWRSAGVDGRGRPFEVSGVYSAVEPPRLLVTSWTATWTGDFRTTVRWELEPTKQGTTVRIRHSGLSGRPDLAGSYRGWPRMLGWLQALLERGETADDRPEASWG